MRAIEEVNPDRFTITAQAGVTIGELQDAARAADRTFAPDWGARGTATIGGAVATNAGGMNVLRYGSIREQVLGLEVVLADGQVWDGLRALRKDNSGYDLKQLFIGSEGTLGIVTRAVVKLHPRRRAQRSAFVALSDIDRLSELHNLALATIPDGLTAFELVPELGVALVCGKYPNVTRPVEAISEWYVLVRVAGQEQVADQLIELLAAGAEAGLVIDAVVAETAAQDANLWTLRDELTPVRLLDGYILKYDLAVPIDRISELHRGVRQLVEAETPGAVAYAFGHVGDGNLHLSVWPGTAEPERFAARLGRLQAAIDTLTWDLGGTISAEHGIGQELVDRLAGQKSAVELDLMRRIKQVLDPDQRLNPGKLLPKR
jgi:FAD/FMN-containing dehydrogenase